MTKPRTVHVQTTLSLADYRRLEKAARGRGVPKTHLIREAIRHYLTTYFEEATYKNSVEVRDAQIEAGL